MSAYVVKNFEPGLWTVGHYQPDGKFDPEADYTDPVAAGQRCHFLNGGGDAARAELAQAAESNARLRAQLADLRTSLDYCAGQWAANAMPHTNPARSGEYRAVMADCARDLRYALKANAPDAADVRAERDRYQAALEHLGGCSPTMMWGTLRHIAREALGGES